MNNTKIKKFEKSYLLIEIERLDKTLLKNGIAQKKKRRDICEEYFFGFCDFLDEGKIRVSGEDTYVTLAFPKKSTNSSLHESIYSLIGDYYEKNKKGVTQDRNLPSQTPLAFWLILKPEKHNPIHIAVFENSSDAMITSRIKQSIVGHLSFLGAVKSVNDKTIYEKMDTKLPLHKIHPSLVFSESLGIQLNPQSRVIKRPDIDVKNISIDSLTNVARELLYNKSFQPTPKRRG